MTRHPQSANAPEAKKRNGTALSLGKAVDMLIAIEAAQVESERQAIEAVRARFVERKAAIYGRVPPHLVDAVGSAIGAARAAVGEFAERMNAADPAPAEAEPADDVPSRPSLEEYDGVPERLREPLSPERLAVARGRK